jgi:hypothetical protein
LLIGCLPDGKRNAKVECSGIASGIEYFLGIGLLFDASLAFKLASRGMKFLGVEKLYSVVVINGFGLFFEKQPLRSKSHISRHRDDRAIIMRSAIIEIASQHDRQPIFWLGTMQMLTLIE